MYNFILFRFGEDYFSTSTDHPFLALWWIENNRPFSSNYSIRVWKFLYCETLS